MEGIKTKTEELLELSGIQLKYINGKQALDHDASLHGGIENFIGYTQIPLGVAGPITVRGSQSTQEHLVPMATTEGALVASYNRGLKACNLSGGITAIAVDQAVQRSPYFKFPSIDQAIKFVDWVSAHKVNFQDFVSQSSKHAQLTALSHSHEGNAVNLTMAYTTGGAAGQNMTTIATAMICQYILESCPVKPMEFYIEGNFSGDKKGNLRALSSTRGKKVIAEVTVPETVVREVLKTSPRKMHQFWQAGTLSGIQIGAVGNYGHISNALTAIFIACGQDVATVSEAAVGIVRMELTREGALYASLTCPNLIVGTIGGGTTLPTQKEALALMGCSRPEDAAKFAEVCCATALAGELSIGAAITAGQFAQAHQQLGRKT